MPAKKIVPVCSNCGGELLVGVCGLYNRGEEHVLITLDIVISHANDSGDCAREWVLEDVVAWADSVTIDE